VESQRRWSKDLGLGASPSLDLHDFHRANLNEPTTVVADEIFPLA
jgi:hypothetical protein